MELIVIAIAAVALGVLATVLLALCLPADVHERAGEHGRFAGLGDAPAVLPGVQDEAAGPLEASPRMSAYEGPGNGRPARARAIYHANAMREALRRRWRRPHAALRAVEPPAAAEPSTAPGQAVRADDGASHPDRPPAHARHHDVAA